MPLKILGILLLQLASFSILMSAAKGRMNVFICLPIGCLLSI